MIRICSKCRVWKTADQYNHDISRKDGLQGLCKTCTYIRDHQYHLKRKQTALSLIGGPVCALCGCCESTFLTVDHAANDGCKHRIEIGKGDCIHAWILKATPTQLQAANLRVLCGSCQKATQHYSDAEVRVAIAHEKMRIKGEH